MTIGAGQGAARPARTIGRLMRAIAAVGLALGLLRSAEGPLSALFAGAIVVCYLAPALAYRGMRKLDRDLADLPPDDPKVPRRASLRAQAFVLILFAWTIAGVALAGAGLAAAHWLRPDGP